MQNAIKIVGVDFSGAASDDKTWLSQGELTQGQSGDLELVPELVLEECRRVSRVECADIFEAAPAGTVASLDFPFSVPRRFAAYWIPEARSMPDLWSAAAGMGYPDFLALRDAYVAIHGETKRACDLRFPECYSCLHKANPNMVPMTFRGMQMLDRLWAAGCQVPPLASQNPGGPVLPVLPVLLEAMPGAALKALGLPHKGYKNGVKALDLRRQILNELPVRSGVAIPNLPDYHERCMASHDCLDAVVAAVTAVLWARQPELFWRPEDPGSSRSGLEMGGEEDHLESASLEGWLYAPVHLSPVAG